MSTPEQRLTDLKRRDYATADMPRETTEQLLAFWRECLAVAEGFLELFTAEVRNRSDFDSVAGTALVWAKSQAEEMAKDARRHVDELEQRITRDLDGDQS